DIHDRSFVPERWTDHSARRRVPHLGRAVVTGCSQPATVGAEAHAPDRPAMAKEENVLAADRVANTRRTVAASQRKPAAVWTKLGYKPGPVRTEKVRTAFWGKVPYRIRNCLPICSIPNANCALAGRDQAPAIRAEHAPKSPIVFHGIAEFVTSGGIKQLPFSPTHNEKSLPVRTEPDHHPTPQQGKDQTACFGVPNPSPAAYAGGGDPFSVGAESAAFNRRAELHGWRDRFPGSHIPDARAVPTSDQHPVSVRA